MTESIIMPKAGMAMEKGVIVKWLIKEGDTVRKGDVVAEVETGKATMEIEAETAGTVLKILFDENETVPVTETLAWLGQPGESIPGISENCENRGEPKPEKPITGTGTADKQKEADSEPFEGKIKATPAARRIAAKRNIPLAQTSPTGRHGEIRRGDIPLIRQVETEFPTGKTIQNNRPLLSKRSDTRVPLTNFQKIAGRRLFRSHSEIPAVTIDTRADVTGLLTVRKQLTEALHQKITVNDFLLKATAIALEEHPKMNSVLDGNDLICKGSINLNMAVATDHGVMVPVIRNANLQGMKQISQIAEELIRKGREGRLEPEDLEGGTFTVSNVGMFGITSFTPIINQFQAAILGICGIEKELQLIDGKVVERKKMGLSLTFDHRIVDGMESARFIGRIRGLLENPLTIVA